MTSQRTNNCFFAIFVLALAICACANAQSFGTYSDWMNIAYDNGTTDFVINLLNLGYYTGVTFEWTLIDMLEYHVKDDGLFTISDSLEPLQSGSVSDVMVDTGNITLPFKAEHIGHNATLDVLPVGTRKRSQEIFDAAQRDIHSRVEIPGGFVANGYLFQENSIYQVDGQFKAAIEGSFKFGMNIYDWPWLPATVGDVQMLRMVINVDVRPVFEITNDSFIYDVDGFLSKIHIEYQDPTYVPAGSATGWDINLGHSCQLFGNTTGSLIRITHTYDETDFSAKIMFDFPFFNDSLVYDPDVSPLISPAKPGGGDGQDNTLAIAAGVAIPVFFIAVCCVAVILVAIVVWRYIEYRRNRSNEDNIDTMMINF